MSERLPELLDAKALQTDPTTVYIARRRRSVLYVGITGRNLRRMHAHARASKWWGQATRIELRHLPTRAEAEALEEELIGQWSPPFNVQHRTDLKPPPAAERPALPAGLIDFDGLLEEIHPDKRLAATIMQNCPPVERDGWHYVERAAVNAFIDAHKRPPTR